MLEVLFKSNPIVEATIRGCMTPSTSSNSAKLTLGKDGFYDLQGRRLFFRGINVASNAKFPPFIPFKDPIWWDRLKEWGFNMVRLTIFWEAIEPEPGRYDRAYLSQVKEMVDQASSRGIYVLVDMHQDLYSRGLKGDGAPAWTFPKDVDPKKNDGFGGQFWGTAYFLSEDVQACFTNFFRSKELKNHYRDALLQVASLVKDNPLILGYDLMNEPSSGDILNFFGDFENGYLKPLYEDTIKAVRKVHRDAVGFVEPHGLDSYTSKLMPFSVDRLVYAPHMYSHLSVTLRYKPAPEDFIFSAMVAVHQLKAAFLGMPLFIGEFGAPWTMQPPEARDMAVNEAMKAIEYPFVDSAYWDYSVKDVDIWNEEDFSIIDQNGNPRGLKANVRPYLRRLAGTPSYQSFDQGTRTYTASFRAAPQSPPAVFYIPQDIHYPKGFQVKVSDGRWDYDPKTGELSYYPSYKGNHTLSIRAGG